MPTKTSHLGSSVTRSSGDTGGRETQQGSRVVSLLAVVHRREVKYSLTITSGRKLAVQSMLGRGELVARA